jgi:UDP-N-acetylglucosamine 2-epimerase (non-hydrolysing)
MAPVVSALQKSNVLQPVVCVTAQHRELLDQVMQAFHIRADYDLNIMVPQQSLERVTTSVLQGVDSVIAQCQPDFMLVQGDTTTAFAAALAGFYEGVPVGHVEAGLRTADPRMPFPEEMNRRIISQLSSRHYAPTQTALDNLRREGIADSRLLLTGNTVVDACNFIRLRGKAEAVRALQDLQPGTKKVLVTMHRRENWGEPMRRVCSAVSTLALLRPELRFIFPVHPNPQVRDLIQKHLGGNRSVHIIDPLPYPVFISLMDTCDVVLTDSGGIQEEVASLGKPVVILRDETERPEIIENGYGLLAGTSEKVIVEQTLYALLRWTPPGTGNPFGDGYASSRILQDLEGRLALMALSAAAGSCAAST